MSIVIDDSKVREAARQLYEATTDLYEKPDVTVFANAVIRWIELAAEDTLNDPLWYSDSPHSNIADTWGKALDWARNGMGQP